MTYNYTDVLKELDAKKSLHPYKVIEVKENLDRAFAESGMMTLEDAMNIVGRCRGFASSWEQMAMVEFLIHGGFYEVLPQRASAATQHKILRRSRFV